MIQRILGSSGDPEIDVPLARMNRPHATPPPLAPVDFRILAPALRLYLSQVCDLAGISKMQLDYWTTKASIPTSGRKQRIYDYDAIVLVLLIKQARDCGMGLPAAIEAAQSFMQTGQHVVTNC